MIQSNAENEHISALDTFKDATHSDDANLWKQAMQEEFDTPEEMGTWKLVSLPKGRKATRNRWVYVMRKDIRSDSGHDSLAKGYSQVPGIDFDEVFASVANYSTVRMVLPLSAAMGWRRIGIDIKSAFLNSELDEELYTVQTDGIEVEGKETWVYRLYKALY